MTPGQISEFVGELRRKEGAARGLQRQREQLRYCDSIDVEAARLSGLAMGYRNAAQDLERWAKHCAEVNAAEQLSQNPLDRGM